jgi:hypothetical protein
MADMVSTTVAFPKWTLSTSADMDACAEELFTAHRIASESIRAWDHTGVNIRKLQIHHPDPDNPAMATAEVGQIVIFFNGSPEALTTEEYAARGYSA